LVAQRVIDIDRELGVVPVDQRVVKPNAQAGLAERLDERPQQIFAVNRTFFANEKRSIRTRKSMFCE
jgi:hypothetical protein